MKLWILYISGSFVIGVLMWRTSDSTRAKAVAAMCLFLCIGYYFLHQI